MTRKNPPPRPTPGELEILHVLWRRGPSTVREVHEGLPPGRTVGYTTILKLMQIMAEKGLVTRDQETRSHVYRPAVSEKAAQRRLVTDLIDRAFGGSAVGLAMRALSDRRASAEELGRLRALLDEQDRGGKP